MRMAGGKASERGEEVEHWREDGKERECPGTHSEELLKDTCNQGAGRAGGRVPAAVKDVGAHDCCATSGGSREGWAGVLSP